MSKKILTTAERWRRFLRDQKAYRRRSQERRMHARFQRDLEIVPHLFLAVGASRTAVLCRPYQEVRDALRGKAVWTLDAAARLVGGRGFLAARDLTGYMSRNALDWACAEGLIEPPGVSELSVDPLYERPSLLIAHIGSEPPPHIVLPSGDRVVTLDFLKRDLMGTLGWRPNLLTRLETVYGADKQTGES